MLLRWKKGKPSCWLPLDLAVFRSFDVMWLFFLIFSVCLSLCFHSFFRTHLKNSLLIILTIVKHSEFILHSIWVHILHISVVFIQTTIQTISYIYTHTLTHIVRRIHALTRSLVQRTNFVCQHNEKSTVMDDVNILSRTCHTEYEVNMHIGT